MTIHVPRLRLPDEQNPRLQPHILIITGDTADDRDWEIEHPDACPMICFWTPTMAEAVAQAKAMEESSGIPGLADASQRDCYVQWEVTNAGLDTTYGELDGKSYELGWDHKTKEYGWRQLPAGRYVIEGWYQPGGWAGSEPIDPDGGITLVGREGA